MLRVNRDDQSTSGVGAFEHTEASRRISNAIRYGVVKEADYENALIRLELQDGELLTDWIPWITLRAGGDKFWWAPEEGEVMMLLSPSGELANAVALPAADSYTAAGWATREFTFTLSSVSDFNDLRLRFTQTASGGNNTSQRSGLAVSWAEIDIPDPRRVVVIT